MKLADDPPSFLSTQSSPWHLAETKDENAMWLAWLVRLRWVAIIGQIVTVSFVVSVLDSPAIVIPLMLGAAGVLGLANTWAIRQLHGPDRIGPETLLIHLSIDVVVLTGFFLAAGGADNPFVPIYLIHVAMAAVMMPPRFALVVMGFVVVANVALHQVYLPLHPERHGLPPNVLMGLGQVVALTVTVISVGGFVLGMASTLRRQKQRLYEARERTAQTDRLRAVGTLAAGAAHELNTPLSTMGLRLRRIARRYSDDDTTKDLGVIQGQLERCTDIVEQLLVGAGDPSASGFERAPLQDFVAVALRLWSKGSPLDVRVRLDEEAIPVELPNIAFTQAFINLLENAREAQAELGRTDALEVEVRRDGHYGVVRIVDHGPGLPPESDRVGEPFFTTKPTGTGLGVFVARALADGAGGGLAYAREHDRTITRWYFPQTGRTP
ncbi:MAG: HAMP domain-containing histidine kinase [Alphaproteobacteria bacterium]|nr:HAMP domain-containing histidine kinase [Alphaproteobacteria bacterium]